MAVVKCLNPNMSLLQHLLVAYSLGNPTPSNPSLILPLWTLVLELKTKTSTPKPFSMSVNLSVLPVLKSLRDISVRLNILDCSLMLASGHLGFLVIIGLGDDF